MRGERIVLLRDIGKLIFITLRDAGGTIQLGLSKKLLEAEWSFMKLLDLGDIIGAEGQLGRTKTGEITIWADQVTVLSKSLEQPPEKFHGLADVDMRYRMRYVELVGQSGSDAAFYQTKRYGFFNSPLPGCAGISGGGNPDDAGHCRRRCGQAFYDTS